MIEDEEHVAFPVSLVAPCAKQSEHGLTRPRAADDEMLSFRRQGESRILLLAEFMDTR